MPFLTMKFSPLSLSLVFAYLAVAANADFAEDTCEASEWVPQDNSKSPTTKVRCCAGQYGKKDLSWASCDTSSCPNNFNHAKNRNCFNYGSPQNGNNQGSKNCPYADSDHAICDTTFYDKTNPVSCRTNPNGKNYQVHCLGKVKCNTVGVTVPKTGHSDGTADHDDSGNTQCAGAVDGFKAGDDCFYDGSSENWKVCDGPLDPEEEEEEEDSQPVPSGGSYGDPHIKTWGGDQYDFHGACDLVLVNAPEFADGKGLDVHIRTKIKTWWSYIESAAIKIGDDTFEVKGGSYPVSYWINGVEGKAPENKQNLESTVGGHEISYNAPTDHQSMFFFHGLGLSIETYNEFVRVNVRAGSEGNLDGALGLMGTFPEGAKVARDGKTVMVDMDAFGQEWQVRDTEDKLFHVLAGAQHPAKCMMPTVAQRESRRLRESSIDLNDAKKACARVAEEDFDACVFDVLATNDKNMAGSY